MSTEKAVIIVGAVGALGAASYAIVDALKWTPLGTVGFGGMKHTLGEVIWDALRDAYGGEFEKVLRAKYREGGSNRASLASTLRQGVRIALLQKNSEKFADELKLPGETDAEGNEVAFAQSLASAVAASEKIKNDPDPELSDAHRTAIGRFELAVDARIEAAIILARDTYGWAMRISATLVSVFISCGIFCLEGETLPAGTQWYHALFIGFAAVPLAPIASDLVKAMQSAKQALRARK